MAVYEGWEGSILYGVETTPGTAAATIASPLGVVKNFNGRTSASLEEEGAIGTYATVSLEEGLIEDGGSAEFIPAGIAALLQGKRNAQGKLPSLTMHTALGPGQNHLGAKINQLRFTQDAGGRLRCSIDWMSYAAVPAAHIAMVIPTEEEMNWIKCVTNLEAEVFNWELVINHNLQRRAIIPNAATVFPVPAAKRAPFVIREGPQRVQFTARFTDRPSASVIETCLAALGNIELLFTGCVGATPLSFKITANSGKPNMKEINAADSGEGTWPIDFRYLNWDVALNPPPP